jgi:hypothetical protein
VVERGAQSCFDALVARVRQQLAPPDDVTGREDGCSLSAPVAGLRRFQRETLHARCWASGYELLRWIFLPARPFSLGVDNGLERERNEAWARTREAAEGIAGASFREILNARLRERWIRTDNLAVHYSHRFRSAFVTNFALAAVAVLVGLLAVLFWESKGLKAVFVVVELMLIGIILWNTRRGRIEAWHDRWLDYRSLAEALRPARLPLLIGSSPIRPGSDVASTPGQSWIAWYVRASLREIEPPTAVIGSRELHTVLDVTLTEEVDGQLAYHRKNAAQLRLLDHRLEHAAEVALWATVASGLVYILTYGLYAADWQSAADVYKPLATLLGGTLPVIGAAIFGIRATGDFRSAARLSQRMVAELEHLRAVLMTQLAAPNPLAVRRLLGQVGRAMSDDLRIWGMIYSERELVPGF